MERENSHPVGIHRLASIKIEVLEIRFDMLGIIISHSCLKLLDRRFVRPILLELLNHFLQIA